MHDPYLIGRVLDRLDADADGALERLRSVLRIPSVSPDPAHAADCARAAEWFRDQLLGLGFEATVQATNGHPVVLAHRAGPPDTPHLLFYGHYDVQPADPLALWDGDPFEMRTEDGPFGPRLVARGAADDKGQCLCWLEAFRAWIAVAGALPVGVTVLVEGEEEIGSPSLDCFLQQYRDALRADLAVISDTYLWNIDTPTVVSSLRGQTAVELSIRGADRDLHSGMYGGSALNPIHVLTGILHELHDGDGRVALAGFYDAVRPPVGQLEGWRALGFDEARFLAEVGLSQPEGERGRDAVERLWGRPTAEVNGIWGGYVGAGPKAVIPARAGAKVSFRLVAGQDPIAIATSFERFVRARLPADASLDYRTSIAYPAFALDAGSAWMDGVRAAVADEFVRPLATIGVGGGIPVVESLKRILGLDALLLGFGLDDDRYHSPNEKFEFACFRKGTRTHVRLLAELARVGAAASTGRPT